jgi:hypothetical protein
MACDGRTRKNAQRAWGESRDEGRVDIAVTRRRPVAKGLMTQDEYDQEWYLSVDAAVKGAWFAKELAFARQDGRITRVPYDAALPVDTDWDLGMDDSMAIWFSQSLRSGEIRLVDYYEGSGEGFSHYVRTLREKPYVYGKHYPPHDIAVRELGTGKSRKEVAATLGLRFEDPLPAASKTLVRPKTGRSPAAPVLPLEALERQQQRILHRTQLIDYVLAAEQRNGGTLTLGVALAELLQDITDAARAIGAIVQQATR